MKSISINKLLPGATLLLTLLLLLSNCKTNQLAVMQLNGTWQEKEPEGIIQMAGTGHYFKFFKNQTFHLEQQSWTDAVTAGDPCGFSRTDYIKGSYKLKGNTLKLSGKYCDKEFKTNKPNCKGHTSFKNEYIVDFQTERIILNFDQTVGRQIHLIKQ